jgi:hypothetical protein
MAKRTAKSDNIQGYVLYIKLVHRIKAFEDSQAGRRATRNKAIMGYFPAIHFSAIALYSSVTDP